MSAVDVRTPAKDDERAHSSAAAHYRNARNAATGLD
jgi:hypothetical protein